MKSTINSLTGIRGPLALLVLGFHLLVLFPANAITPRSIFQYGYISVDGFFILSGFILALVHGQEMRAPTIGVIRNFFVARFARIYPLHILTFVAFALSLWIGLRLGYSPHAPERYSAESTIANLLLVHAWIGLSATWDTTSWSISCEFAAYLAFPIFAFIAARSRNLIFIGASIAIFVIAEWIFRTDQHTNLTKIFPEFLLGMALYRLPRISGARADFIASMSGVLALLALCLNQLPLVVTLLGIMIYSLRDAKGAFSNALSSKPMLYLGEISYAVYLWQGLTLLVVKHSRDIFSSAISTTMETMAALAALVLTLICAAVSHTVFELPARKLIRRRFGVRTGESIGRSVA